MGASLEYYRQPIWIQQPSEPDVAYQAFLLFAGQPKETRNLKAVGETMGQRGRKVSQRQLNGWQRRWAWVERAQAWDAYKLREMEHVWMERELATRERLWSALERILALVEDALNQEDFRLTPTLVTRYLDLAFRLRESLLPKRSMTSDEIRAFLQALPAETRYRVVQLLMAEGKTGGEHVPNA